jgi:TPR repeat protein
VQFSELVTNTIRDWLTHGFGVIHVVVIGFLLAGSYYLFFSRRAPLPLQLMWWKLLSRFGHVQASVRLAARISKTTAPGMSSGRTARSPRNQRARKYLKRAAKGGHAESALTVGKAYVDGTLGRMDLFQGERYLRMASEGGLAEADYHLGLLLETGLDIEGAQESLERAATRGYTQALAAVAELTERHLMPKLGREAVMAAYRRAAQAGISSSAIRLAELLTQGKPVPSNYTEALSLLQSKFCRNERRAQFLTKELQASGHDLGTVGPALVQARIDLATACWQGKGTDPDWPAAWRWASQAAATGDKAAVYLVGRFLLDGVGVIRDPEQAARHFEVAALQGHQEAQFELARLLAAAGCSDAELEQAYAWAAVAALEGNPEHVAWRDGLATRMDRASQHRAVAKARELAIRLGIQGSSPALPGAASAPPA